MRAASIEHNNLNIEFDRPTFVDKWAKKLVFRWLESFTQGSLTIEDQGERFHFGQSLGEADVAAHIIVRHDSVYRDVLFNGTVGSGEAYMKGSWESPNLVNVIRLMCNNMDRLNKINRGWSKINSVLARSVHHLRANNKQNARLNIAAHYDLGNDFFEQFLDPTMMYSSAIYPDADSHLHDAAVYKLDHICKRLKLNPDDHLLEIGTGWGGMAIHAAKNYGCRVTTTTISREQFEYVQAKVKAEGLENKIMVLFNDYRDLEGQFDKLVSIEMIEAVGRQYLSQYFSTCSCLLKDNGLMLIQAITMTDQRYDLSAESSDFIQRYIFPGGDLPSLSVMSRHVGRDTDMQVVGVEDITQDYARTLSDWRKAFFEKLPVIKAQGYDDVFIRMWDFYLSYCEGGFRERTIGTQQLLMAKRRCQQLPEIYAH